jgi:hypothetical protein
MKKVEVRPVRGGRTKLVPPRYADMLVRLGKYERVDAVAAATAPQGDGFDDLPYNELRSLAAARGVEPEGGRKREHYVRALRGYNRRDMRAR